MGFGSQRPRLSHRQTVYVHETCRGRGNLAICFSPSFLAFQREAETSGRVRALGSPPGAPLCLGTSLTRKLRSWARSSLASQKRALSGPRGLCVFPLSGVSFVSGCNYTARRSPAAELFLQSSLSHSCFIKCISQSCRVVPV